MSSITLALVQIKCYTNYMEKEKFYIFLDIDGTLYTQQDIRERTPAGFPMYISEVIYLGWTVKLDGFPSTMWVRVPQRKK